MVASEGNRPIKLALEFTHLLTQRQYDKAYMLTTRNYQDRVSLEKFGGDFEAIIPLDWGATGPIAVGDTTAEWPGKKSSELMMLYVSVGGELYSEAVNIIISCEGNSLKINSVEFGRP